MTTFLIAFVIFGLAIGAMAVGVLLSGRKLTRTCASGGTESECGCARARAEALAAGEPRHQEKVCLEAKEAAGPCGCSAKDARHDCR